MLFALVGERVVLGAEHPLAREGSFDPLVLVEACAQLAGRQVPAGAGTRGMLVEVHALRVLTPGPVPAGSYPYAVTLSRRADPLWRFEVTIPSIIATGLTLRLS
jgi:hypothetical protein